MKENKNNPSVATNVDGFEFTIANNSQIFDLIINKLYSNKIGAVVRELGANAVDSHKMAGHNKPFDIHLPNRIESYFYIRDYGTGLDSEEIRELYTCLGASSKRQTNNQIGCFGIGSKSPFAYTDSFTIVSYKDGTRNTYQAFIGKDKKPEIAIFEESTKTDEPNGLKVQMDVKFHDINRFEEEVHQYEFFPIKPNFIGKSVDIIQTEYSTKTNDYGIRKSIPYNYYNYTNRLNNCRVVMGGIKYKYTPQDISWLENEASGIDLFFDIGEVNITGSREEIEYDEYSLTNIKNRFKKIETEIEQKLQNEIDNCKNWYEACKQYKDNSISRRFNLVYKNKKLEYATRLESTKGRAISFRKYGRRSEGLIETTFDNIFVENDLKTGAISRCKNICTQNPILFFFEDGDKDIIKKSLDIDDSYFTKASSLVKPPKATSNRTTVSGGIYQLDFGGGYGYQILKPTNKIPDKSYYVILDRQKPSWNNKRLDFDYVNYIADILNIKDVYGINKSSLKKSQINTFVNLFEYFDGYKCDFDYLYQPDHLQYFERDCIKNMKGIKNKHIEKYISDVEEILEYKKYKSKKDKIITLSRYFNIVNGKTNKVNKKQSFENVNKRYPLLKSHLNNCQSIDINLKQHIQQYLNCIGE